MTREHSEVRLHRRYFSRTWEVVRVGSDGQTITDRWPLHADDCALLDEAMFTPPPTADQPPVCPDHREAQHRDNKPPWCDSCGWRHGEPARRYGDGRVVA